MIALIEKLWWDDLENRNSYGYEPFGYVETEEAAIKLVTEGGVIAKETHWAFFDNKPAYRYKLIENLSR